VIDLYTDGSCETNPGGRGGWAAILLGDIQGSPVRLHGAEDSSTNNRMELTAAIKGLEATPSGAEVTVWSDSEYLVKTMTQGWRRRANVDLWGRLDQLAASHRVRWEWVRGHDGHPWNEEADRLAGAESQGRAEAFEEAQGRTIAEMIDVSGKDATVREATAEVVVAVGGAYAAVRGGTLPKGDVLAMAQAAGIMAAKQTPFLLPLCHPLPLEQVSVSFRLRDQAQTVVVTASVKTTARTGPEMEALTAASVAALTIYDMCKGVDPAIRIDGLRLLRKSGGKSGTVVLSTPTL